MKFYHSTTNENADAIIDLQCINISEYNLGDYIQELLINGWFDKEIFQDHEFKIPSTYKDANGIVHYVYWLGKGVYCFAETDLQQAVEYSVKHDAIIEIHITEELDPIKDIFNMDSKQNRLLLEKFITEDLNELEKNQNTSKDKEYVFKFRRALKACMDNHFLGTPHAAGILIDLYLSIYPNFKIVKGSFILGGGKKTKLSWLTTYIILKNTDIISSLNKLQ